MPPHLELRAALRARLFPGRPRREAEAARALAGIAEGVLGVVFFGSLRTQANPDPWSAHDFFVAVRDTRPFYASLRRAGRLRRSPRLLTALNHVLTPSQISLQLPNGAGAELHAKCSVITLAQLVRETSPARKDHFTIGRLFQPSEVLFAADARVEEDLLDVMVAAQAGTWGWVRPWLPDEFDADGFGRTLLRVSLGFEIRPEPTVLRADALYEAQREEQRPIHELLLRSLVASGELRASAAGFRLTRPAGLRERLRLALYFQRSRLRATARWFKHVLTFDDWLDYMLRKVRRHAGVDIVLTPRERAHPLVFLWPKLFRYLRHKNQRAGRPS